MGINDYVIIGGEETLTPSVGHITVAYTDKSVTKTAKLPLTVAPRALQSIEIESYPTKLRYIQGQTFGADGLKVTARYEYMDLDVTGFLSYDYSGKLRADVDKITVSYTEGQAAKSLAIDIEVEPPYIAVRKIALENPFDATLSWVYSYTDDGDLTATLFVVNGFSVMSGRVGLAAS